MIRALLLILLISWSSNVLAAIDWNEHAIKWHEYSEGLQTMKEENKNGILIIYSNKCRACYEYAKMFKSQSIVEYSRDVVLIRVDRDRVKLISEDFQNDGNYVPRTILLNSKGEIIPSPYKTDEHLFFLPPGNEKYLSELMRRLAKKPRPHNKSQERTE